MFNPITGRHVESRENFKMVVPMLAANIIPTLPQFSEMGRTSHRLPISLPKGVGPSSFWWPECPAYWSLDPLGVERLTADEATELGFPSLQLNTAICAKSWDASVYAGLRQFHKAKDFDPGGRGVADYLEEPLYQLSNEIDVPFSHVDDEDACAEEDDQDQCSMDLSWYYGALDVASRPRRLPAAVSHSTGIRFHEILRPPGPVLAIAFDASVDRHGQSLSRLKRSSCDCLLNTMKHILREPPMPQRERPTLPRSDLSARLRGSILLPLTVAMKLTLILTFIFAVSGLCGAAPSIKQRCDSNANETVISRSSFIGREIQITTSFCVNERPHSNNHFDFTKRDDCIPDDRDNCFVVHQAKMRFQRVLSRSSFIGCEIQITTSFCVNERPHSNNHFDFTKRDDCIPDDRDNCEVDNCTRGEPTPPPTFLGDCNNLIAWLDNFAPNFALLANQMVVVTFGTCTLQFGAGAQTGGVCASRLGDVASSILSRCTIEASGGDASCNSGLYELQARNKYHYRIVCPSSSGSVSDSELTKRATCIPDPTTCFVESCLGFTQPPTFPADCKTLLSSVVAFAPNFTVLENQVTFVTFNSCLLDFGVGPQTTFCGSNWASIGATILSRCPNLAGGEAVCNSGLYDINIIPNSFGGFGGF
ncbi:hypothetical protein B0H19DRAFT_1376898 [Mycena capillaripes]|nr:hypothetical protein B0H19DRAFT_1376898 [Mycena capillaripes]